MKKLMLIISVLCMVQLAWSSSWITKRNKKFPQSTEELNERIQKARENPSQRQQELGELMATVAKKSHVVPSEISKEEKDVLMDSDDMSINKRTYVTSNWYHKQCTKLGPGSPSPCGAGFVYNKCLRSCYFIFKRQIIFDGDLLNRTWEQGLYGCPMASVDSMLYITETTPPMAAVLTLPTILPHAVHIQSEAEQSFVRYLIKLYDGEDQDYWTGGIDGEVWLALASADTDNEVATNITGYSDWASGYPGGNEGFMYLDGSDDYKWKMDNDTDDHQDKGVICEVEAEYILDTPLYVEGCFSGDDTVALEDGSSKLMSDVQTGDKVLTVDGSGELVYSSIEYFMHRVEDQHALYISIATDNGHAIELTPEHYIYKVDPNNKDEVIMRYADQIVVGDKVKVINPSSGQLEPETVSGINIVYRKGIYNPRTAHYTIVVNGILASTIAVRSQEVIKQNNLPYLVLDWLTEFIGKTFPHAADENGHHISTYLRPAKQWLVGYYGLTPNYIADKRELFGQLNKGAMDLDNNDGGALKVPFIRSN